MRGIGAHEQVKQTVTEHFYIILPSKDSTAIFWHDGYWASPGTIPKELKELLDQGKIDLTCLAVMSLGPGKSWFARWGSNALWNFDGLDPRDKGRLETTIRAIAADPDRLGGIEGIISFSFGQTGEAVLVHNFGSIATWSNYPPPSGDFTYQINHALQSGKKILQVAIGVGGCSVIQLQDVSGCAWSKHCPDWPPPDLVKYLAKRDGQPLRRVYCSVMDHEYWFVSYINEAGHNVVDGTLEDSAETQFRRIFSLIVSVF